MFQVLLKLLNKILRIITLLSSSKLNTWHTNLKFFKIKATSSILFLKQKQTQNFGWHYSLSASDLLSIVYFSKVCAVENKDVIHICNSLCIRKIFQFFKIQIVAIWKTDEHK